MSPRPREFISATTAAPTAENCSRKHSARAAPFSTMTQTVTRTSYSSIPWTGPATNAPAPRSSSTRTIATALSPTSLKPWDSMSNCMAWASPSAITTTMDSRTFSSPVSDRTVCSATPEKAASSTPANPAALPVARLSALPLCGLITISRRNLLALSQSRRRHLRRRHRQQRDL